MCECLMEFTAGANQFSIILSASIFTATVGSYVSRFTSDFLSAARLKSFLSFGTDYLLALGLLELIPHSYRFFHGSLPITSSVVGLGIFIVFAVEKLFGHHDHMLLFSGKDPSHLHVSGRKTHGGYDECCNISSL